MILHPEVTMNSIPKSLQQKLILTFLVGIGCFIIGLALSVSFKDKTLLYLSAAILIFSTIHSFSLYFRIKSGSYYILDGICISVTSLPFRKNCTAVFADSAGNSRLLHLPKDYKVRSGFSYRLYFRCPPDLSIMQSPFLERAYLSENLLCVEVISIPIPDEDAKSE